jgi:type VI protein secretion system component VasK
MLRIYMNKFEKMLSYLFIQHKNSTCLLGIFIGCFILAILVFSLSLKTVMVSVLVILTTILVVYLIFNFFCTENGKRWLDRIFYIKIREYNVSVLNRVTKHLVKVITVLKHNNEEFGRQEGKTRDGLPCFMIVGSVKSGRSTLLRKSGLKFPIQEERTSVSGSQEEKECCKWWFSNGSVYLNTDAIAKKEDEEIWRVFLKQLKKQKISASLKGIVIVLSLKEVLLLTSEELREKVIALRAQLQILTNILGYHFSLFMIISQCDLLSGFKSYYSDLSPDERKAAWGVRFRESGEKVVAEQFEVLTKKLENECILKILQAKNNEQRELALEYPWLCKKMFKKICLIIAQLCSDNPYQSSIKLKGCYFTASCEEGASIKYRKGDGFYEEESVDAKTFSDREGYFIQELLSEIIVNGSSLLIKTKKKATCDKWRMSITASGLCFVLMISLISLKGTYASNKELLEKSRLAADNLTASMEGKNLFLQYSNLLKVADRIESLEVASRNVSSVVSLTKPIFLSHLNVLKDLLLVSLQRDFLPRIKENIEKELKVFLIQWKVLTPHEKEKHRGRLYILFKNYLMLCFPSVLSPHELLIYMMAFVDDSLFIRPSLSRIHDFWHINLSRFNHLLEILVYEVKRKNPLIDFYVLLPDIHLIQEVRQQLYLPKNSKNLYASIMEEEKKQFFRGSLHSKNNDKERERAMLWNTISPEFYIDRWTSIIYPKFKKLASQFSSEDWVISRSLEQLENGVMSGTKGGFVEAGNFLSTIIDYYFHEYSKVWLGVLKHPPDKNFHTIVSVSQYLQFVLDSKSLYWLRLKKIKNELQAAITWQYRMGVPINKNMLSLENFLTRLFEEKLESKTQRYLNQIAKVKQTLKSFIDAPLAGFKIQRYTQKLFDGSSLDNSLLSAVEDLDDTLSIIVNPEVHFALKTYLFSPYKSVLKTLLYLSENSIRAEWTSKVFPQYQRIVENRFPFNLRSLKEANYEESVGFFSSSTGGISTFIGEDLKGFIEVKNGVYSAHQWLGIGLPFSANFLKKLGLINSFSHLFSREKFFFSISPEPLTKIKQSIFSVGKQHYVYQNGPESWKKFEWLFDLLDLQVQLSVKPSYLSYALTHSFSGVWGIFYLFHQAHCLNLSHEVSRCTWDFHSEYHHKIKTSYLIKFSDPRLLALFTGSFKLPLKIFSEIQAGESV